LRRVLAQLDALVGGHPDDPEFLLRDGFANAMGHNLDFKSCAQRSAKIFEHLLMLRPDDKMANLHYGAFLGGVGRAKESIKYLGKAVELGASEANYSLAITYVMLEDKKQAILHLNTYVSLYPRDEGAKKLLAALESKNLKIERKEGKPPIQSPEPTAPSGRGSP
jgi:predicted Zn-dependent protease